MSEIPRREGDLEELTQQIDQETNSSEPVAESEQPSADVELQNAKNNLEANKKELADLEKRKKKNKKTTKKINDLQNTITQLEKFIESIFTEKTKRIIIIDGKAVETDTNEFKGDNFVEQNLERLGAIYDTVEEMLKNSDKYLKRDIKFLEGIKLKLDNDPEKVTDEMIQEVNGIKLREKKKKQPAKLEKKSEEEFAQEIVNALGLNENEKGATTPEVEPVQIEVDTEAGQRNQEKQKEIEKLQKELSELIDETNKPEAKEETQEEKFERFKKIEEIYNAIQKKENALAEDADRVAHRNIALENIRREKEEKETGEKRGRIKFFTKKEFLAMKREEMKKDGQEFTDEEWQKFLNSDNKEAKKIQQIIAIGKDRWRNSKRQAATELVQNAADLFFLPAETKEEKKQFQEETDRLVPENYFDKKLDGKEDDDMAHESDTEAAELPKQEKKFVITTEPVESTSRPARVVTNVELLDKDGNLIIPVVRPVAPEAKSKKQGVLTKINNWIKEHPKAKWLAPIILGGATAFGVLFLKKEERNVIKPETRPVAKAQAETETKIPEQEEAEKTEKTEQSLEETAVELKEKEIKSPEPKVETPVPAGVVTPPAGERPDKEETRKVEEDLRSRAEERKETKAEDEKPTEPTLVEVWDRIKKAFTIPSAPKPETPKKISLEEMEFNRWLNELPRIKISEQMPNGNFAVILSDEKIPREISSATKAEIESTYYSITNQPFKRSKYLLQNQIEKIARGGTLNFIMPDKEKSRQATYKKISGIKPEKRTPAQQKFIDLQDARNRDEDVGNEGIISYESFPSNKIIKKSQTEPILFSKLKAEQQQKNNEPSESAKAASERIKSLDKEYTEAIGQIEQNKQNLLNNINKLIELKKDFIKENGKADLFEGTYQFLDNSVLQEYKETVEQSLGKKGGSKELQNIGHNITVAFDNFHKIENMVNKLNKSIN